MKQRILFSMAIAAATAGTPAFGQHNSGQNSGNTANNPQNIQSFFKSLAGEWNGEVTTRRENKTSCSLVSASNRIENSGEQFASCFEGTSFGKPFDGASVCTTRNNTFTFAATDSWNNQPARGSFRTNSTGNGFTFAFERTDAKTGRTVKFEQVTTIANSDHYTVECFSFDASGKKCEVMTMDMTRLPEGQKSDAAATFTSSTTLAKARQTLANTAQATADEQ